MVTGGGGVMLCVRCCEAEAPWWTRRPPDSTDYDRAVRAYCPTCAAIKNRQLDDDLHAVAAAIERLTTYHERVLRCDIKWAGILDAAHRLVDGDLRLRPYIDEPVDAPDVVPMLPS